MYMKCSAKKSTYIYEVPEDSVDLKKKIENRDSIFILNNKIIEPVLSEVKHLRKMINE